MTSKCGNILIVLILLFFVNAWAQEKNLTVWPYGGKPDSSNIIMFGNRRVPLINFKKANFENVVFDNFSNFERAHFYRKQAVFFK